MRQSSVSLVEINAVRPSRLGRLWAWCRDHAILLAAVAFFSAMYWPFVHKGDEGEWRLTYLRAAERMQARQTIHRLDEPSAYAYPPAMAMFAMPLAQLPLRWSLAIWYAINVAAMVGAVVCAWRLVAGPPLLGLAGSWSHVYWLGLLLAGRFIVAPLENQQFDVVIAACLFAGCLALSHGRDTQAAVWLGAATAMKCTPLLFA
ncbi:MAG TPA: glycosyltransferase family 87 protein, partial [Pirellulales bacterium]|nr:glycosyltransferase family 87 protein [Pirellulales bacterium]